MPLINCEECNKEISDKAKSCPNCGNPMESPKEKVNPCPKCNAELENGPVPCAKCGNAFVVRDNTGGYRKAFDWETREYYKGKSNLDKPTDVVQNSISKPKKLNLKGGLVLKQKIPNLVDKYNSFSLLKQGVIVVLGGLTLLSLVAFLGASSSGSGGSFFSSGKSCSSYISSLRSNEAAFKERARKSYSENPKVRGKVENIKTGGLFSGISGDADITLDGGWSGSCHLSVFYSNDFTKQDLLRLRTGQTVTAQCAQYQAAWVNGVVFTGCKIL